MIATIVYTSGFRQNLSRFNKKRDPVPSVRNNSPVLNQSQPLEHPSVVEDPQTISRIDSFAEKPYEPKFKTTDLYLTYNIPNPKDSIPPLNYVRTERFLNIKPDLTQNIESANNRKHAELRKHSQILEFEQSELKKVKESQNSLINLIHSQDFRNSNPDVCKKESLELVQCFEQNNDCSAFLKAWKECLKT